MGMQVGTDAGSTPRQKMELIRVDWVRGLQVNAQSHFQMFHKIKETKQCLLRKSETKKNVWSGKMDVSDQRKNTDLGLGTVTFWGSKDVCLPASIPFLKVSYFSFFKFCIEV